MRGRRYPVLGTALCLLCLCTASAFRAPDCSAAIPRRRNALRRPPPRLPLSSSACGSSSSHPRAPAEAASAARSAQSRRRVLGSGISLVAAGAIAAGAPSEAHAICGSKPQSWEFWIPWNEELVAVSNAAGKATSGTRSVFYRVVGDVNNENGSKDKGTVKGKRHLVLVIPDKFRDHEYLATMEALVTSDRRVVLFDAMGTGLSEPLSPEQRTELETNEGKALEFAVKELSDLWGTLMRELKVDQVHVFGHAFGALVANEFAKSNPSAVASLILASPPAALGAPAAKQVLVAEDPTNLCTNSDAKAVQGRQALIKVLIPLPDNIMSYGIVEFVDVVDVVA